jgi:hypothetical protein
MKLASLQLLFCFPLTWASQSPCPSPIIVWALGNCTIIAADEVNDIHSWGIRLGVEGHGDLCLSPSTVVNHTFLTTDDICGPDQLDVQGVPMTLRQCRSRRGGSVPPNLLSVVSVDGLDPNNPGWTKLGNSIESAAQATLRWLGQSVTMTVGLITRGQQSTTSHLGLASGAVLLETLKSLGLIGRRSWGLNVGSQSVLHPRSGSLFLGGYDVASVASSGFSEFTVSNPDAMNDRNCPLQVTVSEMSLNARSPDRQGGNRTTYMSSTIIERAGGMKFCIEP